MENRIIFLAGIKRHKGSLIGTMLLLFFTALSLGTVLTVYQNGGRYVEEQIQRAGFGELTAWVSNVPDMEEFTNKIENQDGIEKTEVQNLLFSEYEGNGVESDSEGQLILWRQEENQYRFFLDDFSGYQDAPDKIEDGTVYVSPSMVSIMDLKIGDSIVFPVARGGKKIRLTVAGYYEDPFMGSSMIGMKGFLISEHTYEEILSLIRENGANSLAREGAMIHMDVEDGITVSKMSQQLNENTPLSMYVEFIHSANAILGFMLILQNAFCGLLAAFAFVLFVVTLIVLGHSISGMIEQDWKNIGILKTIGVTGEQMIRLQMLQYMLVVVGGILLGAGMSVFVAQFISQMIVTTVGVLIPSRLPVIFCVGVFAILLAVLGGFIKVKMKAISLIAPMNVIRGEKEGIGKMDDSLAERGYPKIRAKGLMFHLAVRQILSGKRRYMSACLVAGLLVFFASIAGRMNGWLGADGKGMMDAFNPADLDLGVQVMGKVSSKEIEEVVRSYSEITDSYMLAMPSVSVNGTNYTANVITEPKRFHISRGGTSEEKNEVVLTETVAKDLGVKIGDEVMIRGDAGTGTFTVSGIYHCANDMGANLGMSREGYLTIGKDEERLWCHHYFLLDSSKKEVIREKLEEIYGGDVHVHENTWPGLAGIIAAMHMLLIFMYGMSAAFICIVTILAGTKILDAEWKDLGIYKSIGCSTEELRIAFTVRFGIVAFVGAVFGTAMSVGFTDPIVSAVMRGVGISNFASRVTVGNLFLPGGVIVGLFLGFAYLASRRIKKGNVMVLVRDW